MCLFSRLLIKWSDIGKCVALANTSQGIVAAVMVVQMNLRLQQLDWVSNRAHGCSNMWLISSAATSSLERDALTYGFQRTQCWVLLSFSSKLDSWGCGVIYIPLRPVDFCINLIKTRVGVHSSLGPVFNVNMNHVVAPLILSDDSRSVSPDTSPPESSSHQQTCFSSWSAFFLVFKNLKGSFIFQQSLVFDWVPVRQSLYFFFSWMDSRFILSPSTLLCSLWSVFKPNPSLNAARHTNLSSDTPVAADGVCSPRGGRDFFWSLSEV